MDLDQFFRTHYKGLVGYCSGFGYNPADVEETAADVIHRWFDDYCQKIDECPQKWSVMRRWMARRVLLDLGVRHRKVNILLKAEPIGDYAHFDSPEALLDLKQRLPEASQFMIDYEPLGKRKEWDGKTKRKPGGQVGANDPNDRVRFCREKKRFLQALFGEKK